MVIVSLLPSHTQPLPSPLVWVLVPALVHEGLERVQVDLLGHRQLSVGRDGGAEVVVDVVEGHLRGRREGKVELYHNQYWFVQVHREGMDPGKTGKSVLVSDRGSRHGRLEAVV